MILGTIAQLWRYPVKSMAGERRESVSLAQRGVPGDRGWALYDETRGGITSAKRLPALRGCRARYRDEPRADEAPPAAEITTPGGATFMSDADDAATRMADLLGRPVSFRRLDPAGTGDLPRISMVGEAEETIRALNGLAPGEPMADMSAFGPERLRELRQGNFFDAYPVHVLTRTTLRTLARLAPSSVWDERRFRPNVLLDVDESEGYPEQGWTGRHVRVGRCVLEVVVGCPRCVMVTHAVDELPQDHSVMRTLVRETRHTAGVYARVLESGETRVADRVELL